MATTTNYGWTTPDDTDLVKDGAAAIRTLGSSVDTTTKDLNPSTTEGDLEYRSGTANTNSRLAIGTAGQVLTVNGGATAPEWAALPTGGGIALLSTTTLTGATTTVSAISGAYQDLYVLVTGMTNATANGSFRVAINGSTSLSSQTGIFYANAAGGNFTFYNDYTSRYAGNNSGLLRTDANNSYMLTIFDYASTTAPKTYQNILTGLDGNSSTYIQQGQGGHNSNLAVTSLVFSNAGGNWSTGTVRVYGVK